MKVFLSNFNIYDRIGGLILLVIFLAILILILKSENKQCEKCETLTYYKSDFLSRTYFNEKGKEILWGQCIYCGRRFLTDKVIK